MVLFCFYTFSTITRCLRRNGGIYVTTAIACGPRQGVLCRYGACTVFSCAGLVYKAVMKSNIPRRVFLQQLAQDLSGPHIDERTNTKKIHLQEETFDEGHSKMTKYCQVKGECKRNSTVGTCHECSKSLCGKCTAKTVRLCGK